MTLINLKITFRSLLKNKFNSILTILGVALTFIFLTITFITIRQMTGNIVPDVNKDRTISFNSIEMENGNIHWIDSSLVKSYLYLKEPEYIAYLNSQSPTVYHNERWIQKSIGYVNADFFNIFKFSYIYGRAFTAEEAHTPLIVISDDYAKEYFNRIDVIGEKIKLQGTSFTVTGVFEYPYMFSSVKYHLYIPYAFDNFIPQRDTEHFIYLKAEDKESIAGMKEELFRLHTQFYKYGIIESSPLKANIETLNTIEVSLFASLSTVILLLLLIPAFNILSLNTSHILEQTEELSIKKTYGASRLKLFRELITENFITTIIGVAIGLSLTIPFIHGINRIANSLSSESINIKLSIDLYVIAIVFTVTVIFSLLSTFIPAWSVSGKDIIDGLKGGKS